MNRYRFVEAESSRYPVTRLCRMAQVSPAAYYAWQEGRGAARRDADAALTAVIRAIHAASGGQYGAPRVVAELRAQGHDVGRKRVARLMAAAGLRGRRPPRWVRTTTPDPAPPAIPDRVHREFVATAPDVLWVGDITYVRTWEGWLYLATVLDVFSRRGDRLGPGQSSARVARLRCAPHGRRHAGRQRRWRDLSLRPRLPIHLGRVPRALRDARRPAVDGQDGRVLGQRNG